MEMTVKNFYQCLIRYLDQNDISPYKAAKLCNYDSDSAIYNMIRDERNITIETQGRIIKGLGATIGEFWREPDVVDLTEREVEFIKLSKGLDENQFNRVMAYMKGILDEKNSDNKE